VLTSSSQRAKILLNSQDLLLSSPMKLIEALNIAQQSTPNDGRPFIVALGCGFTPLHLQTFIQARLRQALSDRCVEITTGLYGDLPRTLGRLDEAVSVAMLPLEWQDADPRLGLRFSSDWAPEKMEQLPSDAAMRLSLLEVLIVRVASRTRTIIS